MPQTLDGSTLPHGFTYASTPARSVAYVIDAMVVAGILIAGNVLVPRWIAGSGGLGALGSLVVTLVYFGVGWTRFQASLGQRILGLRVLDGVHGASVTYPQAGRRWLFLEGIPAALGWLGGVGAWALLRGTDLSITSGIGDGLAELPWFGYVVFLLYTTSRDPRHQGFHDRHAQTIVLARAVEPIARPDQHGGVGDGYRRQRAVHGRPARRRGPANRRVEP